MLGGRNRPRIRAPRRINSQADEVDFNKVWKILEASFQQIHSKNASSLSYEELYRGAYQLVLKKKGEQLYDKVVDFERKWLQDTVRGEVGALITPDLLAEQSLVSAERRLSGERFLKSIKQQWGDHEVGVGMISDVTMYLDRAYCDDHKRPAIYTASLQLFRDFVLLSPTVASDPRRSTVLAVVVHTMLDSIRNERDGDTLDKSMLKSCSYMLESMYVDKNEADDQRLYTQCFEPEFLAASEEFYKLESDRLIRESSAGAYCRHAKRRLLEERDRCRSTLSESTTDKIEGVVTDQLVRSKIKDLIDMDSGVTYMIDNDRLEELGLVFELSGRVDPDVPELKNALEKRISEIGKELNSIALAPPTSDSAPANQQTLVAIKWVEDVLSLKDKIDKIWEHSFAKSQAMQTAITLYFSDFINAATFSRGSEYVSLFIDDNMKKRIKDKSDEEIEDLLKKAITLLRYLSDKDMFEVYYKKHLSRRLILAKSISSEAEGQMVMKMKVELGNSFTTKIEAMFKDMLVSKQLTAAFAEHMANSVADVDDINAKPIDLGISVLTFGTWPHDAISRHNEHGDEQKITYPKPIERLKDRFKRFYLLKHNGRALTWHAGMGTADIKARFPGPKRERVYEINVSTYAMIILSLFNDLPRGQVLTCQDIQVRTNIPMQEVRRNLQSLATSAKTRLLQKEPQTKEIKDDDKFCVNENFASKFHKFKVGVIASSNRIESDRERLQTEKSNDESRQLVCEAIIVRIMKQRKELLHSQLISETVAQFTQFKPDISMIKTRIESLIERDYLERTEDSNKYRYLA